MTDENKDENEPFNPEDILEPNQEETSFEEFQQANTKETQNQPQDTTGHPIEARHLEINPDKIEWLEKQYDQAYAQIIAEDILIPEINHQNHPAELNLDQTSKITNYILQNHQPLQTGQEQNQLEAGFYLGKILGETQQFLQEQNFQELILTLPNYENQHLQTINLNQQNKYFNTFLDFSAAEIQRNQLKKYIKNEVTPEDQLAETKVKDIMKEIDRISAERIKDYNSQNSAYRELTLETEGLLRRFNEGRTPLYKEPFMEGLLYSKITELDQKPEEN